MNKKMIFNDEFLKTLLDEATQSPRLRQNYDLRTSSADTSQRMLNALQPGTEVPIHRHVDTTETVICVMGKLEELIYEEVSAAEAVAGDVQVGDQHFREVACHVLAPAEGKYGMQIAKGAWHTIRVMEPSVIFEAKDGAYQR